LRSVGVDLGGTHVKVAVIEDGAVVESTNVPTRSEDGPAAVLDRLAGLAREARPEGSVGLALPGLFDASGNATLLPNLHGDWKGTPIAGPLTDAIGAQVVLVNDGHAFALAESELGAGVGCEVMMAVACGTGVGGGLVLHGALHLGAGGRAGEIGHHTVAEDGPGCACGNHGCLELYAGSRAIARAAGRATFDDAVEAAFAGDDQALAAVKRAGSLIGVAVANVLIFLCPDRVVVGGGVAAAAGDLLLEPLRREVAARAQVAPLDRIEIVSSALGPLAGAVGAALYATS
jgi:glucokinase